VGIGPEKTPSEKGTPFGFTHYIKGKGNKTFGRAKKKAMFSQGLPSSKEPPPPKKTPPPPPAKGKKKGNY